MKLCKYLGIAVAILAIGLAANAGANQSSTGKTLVVHAKTAGGTMAKNIPVPRGASTYKLTVKDADLFSDDILFQDDWESIGDKTQITLQFYWICMGGAVGSTDSSSGEWCAEIVFCVEFNNGVPPMSIEAGCACCGGKS